MALGEARVSCSRCSQFSSKVLCGPGKIPPKSQGTPPIVPGALGRPRLIHACEDAAQTAQRGPRAPSPEQMQLRADGSPFSPGALELFVSFFFYLLKYFSLFNLDKTPAGLHWEISNSKISEIQGSRGWRLVKFSRSHWSNLLPVGPWGKLLYPPPPVKWE